MASWRTPLCPFTIAFSPEKLDEIRIAVVDGFYAVPRGGVGIGGALFGKRDGENLLIQDYRKIETEYLTGPSFRLSASDLDGLKTLLAETKFKDPDVKPVGWFVSHTRTAINLSDSDFSLYRQFFPEPWQITLVLKPDNLGKVRGGYFFRQPGGTVKSDAPVNDFAVDPYFSVKDSEAEEIQAPVELPPATAPQAVVMEDRPLFQSLGNKPNPRSGSRIFLIVLVLALIAAALAGYWIATN